MELNYDDEFKREAIEIFYEGNNRRAVERIKGQCYKGIEDKDLR